MGGDWPSASDSLPRERVRGRALECVLGGFAGEMEPMTDGPGNILSDDDTTIPDDGPESRLTNPPRTGTCLAGDVCAEVVGENGVVPGIDSVDLELAREGGRCAVSEYAGGDICRALAVRRGDADAGTTPGDDAGVG